MRVKLLRIHYLLLMQFSELIKDYNLFHFLVIYSLKHPYFLIKLMLKI